LEKNNGKIVSGKPLLTVTYQHVITAFEDLFNSKTVIVMKQLSKYEVLVILCLHSELTSKKAERISMEIV